MRLPASSLSAMLLAACAAPTDRAETVAEIAAYCDEAAALVDDETTPRRIFADLADGRVGERPLWEEFGSVPELEQHDTGDNLNEIAVVRFDAALPVHVQYLYQSPSRDWAQYVDYCFRHDGSVARIDAELRTFHGHVRATRTMLYSSRGRLLKSDAATSALEPGRPLHHGADYHDVEVVVIGSVAELPFHDLLAGRGR